MLRQFFAEPDMCTSPLYDALPSETLTDFERMLEVVPSARCIILAPVSWCCPELARAMEMTSPLARSPRRTTAGYFMVIPLPILQSTHLICASSSAIPRLVTRLKTLSDQF